MIERRACRSIASTRIDRFLRMLSIAAILLVSATMAAADPPETVNIYGSLTGPDGKPLTGARAWRVRFFDGPATQTANQLGVALAGTVELSEAGSFNIPVAFPQEALDAAQTWYELAVDTDTPPDGNALDDVFADLVRVHSVPFALLARGVVAVDASIIGGGAVDNAEFAQLDGAAANIQAQLDAKAAAGSVYTKTEIDAALAAKADAASVYDKSTADARYINANGDTLTGVLAVVGSIAVDAIGEQTANAGVTIDGVLLKDGAVAGRNVAADGAKLDGIEAGATADQTASEIAALFLAGDQSLDVGAGWLTAAEVRATSITLGDPPLAPRGALARGEGEIAFTPGRRTGDLTVYGDVEVEGTITAENLNVTQPIDGVVDNADKLDGFHGDHYLDASNLNAGTVPSARLALGDADIPDDITASNYLPLAGGSMSGPIKTISTVDGRDVSADGEQLDANTAKLAGIEDGATADQTAQEIAALFLADNQSLNVGAGALTAAAIAATTGTFGTATVTIGDDLLVGAGGKVGIGSTNPSEALDVNGVLAIQDTASEPADTAAKLYNNGGELFWNGAQLTSSGAINAPTPGLQAVTDQGAATTNGISAATLDTGQGANELYPMNQAVQTTSDVAFRSISATTATLESAFADSLYLTTLGSSTSEAFDQICDSPHFLLMTSFAAQSFTAGLTGDLIRFDYGNFGGPQFPLEVRLYQGDGTGGTQLGSWTLTPVWSDGWFQLELSPSAPLTSGQQYTMWIQGMMPLEMLHSSGDPYAGGKLHGFGDDAMDIKFRTLMRVAGSGSETMGRLYSNGNDLYWNGAQLTSSGEINAPTPTWQSVTDQGASTSNAVSISNATASNSSATGALTVAGGLGVGGAIHAGGAISGASTGSFNGAVSAKTGVSVLSGDSPIIALNQDTSQSYPAQAWEMSGNDEYFTFADATASTYPFSIEASAPTDSLVIQADGKVGLGVNVAGGATIDERLHVNGNVKATDVMLPSSGNVYLGSPTANGSWRIRIDGSDLAFERREGGLWVAKTKIQP